jgi:uncharacterized protein (DUF1330 family)
VGCGKTQEVSFRGTLRAEESLFPWTLDRREIPRFARNDTVVEFFGSLPEKRIRGDKTMKRNYKLALAILVGIAIGIVGNTVARARQVKTPPGYVIAEVQIQDPATFKEYADKVAATLPPFGGHYLARNGKITSVEGDAPKLFVIIGFDSAQKAQDWYDSPAYNAIKQIRFNSAKTRLFITEGIAPQ